MSALSELWARLTKSKEYRHALVASELKRGLPRQIRILRKQREWNQQQLAQQSGLTQGAISRAEDPDYGNLTLNNLLHIGSGLDVAFIGKFVAFSEFAKSHALLGHESQLEVPSFNEESKEGASRAIPGQEIPHGYFINASLPVVDSAWDVLPLPQLSEYPFIYQMGAPFPVSEEQLKPPEGNALIYKQAPIQIDRPLEGLYG